MSDAFDLIDQALRSGGPDAGLDFLTSKVLEDRNYPLLFEVRLLKKRHQLGLPLIQVDDGAAMPPEIRREYDQAFIDTAREVGGLFLADGNIQRAWPYFRAIGETAPIAAAIDKLEYQEGMEPIIEIAFMERVHPYKGFEMILSHYGACRAITSFGQFPCREGRDESLRLLVRTLHAELVERLKRVITGVEGQTPETDSVPALIASRDWMFEDGSSYIDTSHVISVVRFSLDLQDKETLALAEELTDYGARLKSPYQERSEPPFDDFYVDHGLYFRALQGKDVDAAIAHFRKKMDDNDPVETGNAPAQTLVGLLARLDRYSEAIEVSQSHLADANPSELSCPSVIQLCFLAGDYDRLGTVARARGDLLNYTAQALASGR
jgi:hypothetical protein